MGSTHSLVYTHLIFSTKNREPFLGYNIRPRLWQYLGGICNELNCSPVQIGGMEDHVHILCILSRDHSLCELLKILKAKSSAWIKSTFPECAGFFWQSGYGAFSVNPLEKDVVVEYIRNQENHHKKKDFREEFLLFLKKYGVEYDEKYLLRD
ncbi:MAG: IS200/IS605 family transposase [Lentisphaeria bacterium]|nr:IS200/IS605 family transposase [Lentisphaeria bacterium]